MPLHRWFQCKAAVLCLQLWLAAMLCGVHMINGQSNANLPLVCRHLKIGGHS
jgi:hypothetical protein